MLKRKVSHARLVTYACCVFAFALCGTRVAFGQFGGGSVGGGGAVPANQVGDGASAQRLYPNGLPKIENQLNAALEHHPEVLAARSRLRTAEAELRQAELKALKDLMVVRDRWEKLNRMIKSDPTANPADIREAMGNLAAIEWELAFLTGARGEQSTTLTPGGIGGRIGGGMGGGGAATRTTPGIGGNIVPRGQRADALREKLEKNIDINFEDTPLIEVVKYLNEKSGLKFVLDKAALDENAISTDLPITCNLAEVELVSALKAIEDLQKPLYFIVRDYGILVTTEDKRSSQTVSAYDFGTLNDAELRDVLQKQRQEENTNKGGGQGGGYF